MGELLEPSIGLGLKAPGEAIEDAGEPLRGPLSVFVAKENNDCGTLAVLLVLLLNECSRAGVTEEGLIGSRDAKKEDRRLDEVGEADGGARGGLLSDELESLVSGFEVDIWERMIRVDWMI